MNFLSYTVVFSFLFFGCSSDDNDDSRLQAVSGIQGQEAAERQVAEENRNWASKAERMENELVARFDFNEALVGNYLGEIELQGYKSFVELTIQHHYVPPFEDDRVRSLEEIAYDLEQISLSLLFKHYTSPGPTVAVVCRIHAVRPDRKNLKLQLAAENCPNFYQLNILPSSDEDKSIFQLSGFMIPGATPGRIELKLTRML
jgi:hypothetical protein